MWLFNWLAVRLAGGRARRLTAASRYDINVLDGLVIGGGDDIDAALYGGSIEPAVRIDRARDAFELKLLDAALRRCLPVLGICRGAQMINIFLGGSLVGCIYAANRQLPRRTALPRKTILLAPRSRLRGLIGKERCRVNALHHQAVDEPAPSAIAIVGRDTHGIVQALEVPAYPFLIGVQWHPEFLIFDADQRRLYRALIAAAVAGRATSPAGQAPAHQLSGLAAGVGDRD